MKLTQIFNEDHDLDALFMSDDELEQKIRDLDGSEDWHEIYYREYAGRKARARKSKENEIELDPSTVFYRGSDTKRSSVEPRKGYATFVTSNPYQAATYAGPDGYLTTMTLHPKQAILFSDGSNHSFVKYDEQSAQAGPGRAIVAKNIADRGPYTDGIDITKAKADINVGFTDPSIAKVIKTIPAAKYFNS